MSPPTRSTSSEVDTRERVRGAVAAALERKAQDLRVLHLGPVSAFTEYFLICSGTSERQVQAISDSILEALKASGVRPLHVEGQRGGSWVLLDYGDLVAHVFQPELREFYGLERLWSDAPDETERFGAHGAPH
ncbi:MAG: ribosome silencing factor [Thermoanaerobaculia bacterium]